MDPFSMPVKLDIEPGEDTSEHARASFLQWTGGGLFTGVLGLAVARTDIAPSIIITALICAALLGLIPTLHYIASRRAIKCDRLRAEAEIHKQQIARQAAVAGRDTARTT